MERFDSPVSGEDLRHALGSVRLAKNVFWCLIFLAVGAQLAAFVLVRFAGVIDDSKSMRAARAAVATRPAEAKPAEKKPAETASASAEVWRQTLGWVLPAGKFAGLVSSVLLALTLMFAVKLALHGQTGGVAGLISAFFWSLLLWAVLVPWQQVLPQATFACGSLSNLGELMDATAKATAADAQWLSQTLYYARFAAYPGVALLLWLIVQVRFVGGYRQAVGVGVAEVSALAAGPESRM